jgi:hypothetical protein
LLASQVNEIEALRCFFHDFDYVSLTEMEDSALKMAQQVGVGN